MRLGDSLAMMAAYINNIMFMEIVTYRPTLLRYKDRLIRSVGPYGSKSILSASAVGPSPHIL